MNEGIESRMIRALVHGVLAIFAIAAVVWGVLVTWCTPNLLGSPMHCGESAAIATLKNIASGQMAFRERAAVDHDGDGIGEFGWLTELAAARPLRGNAAGDVLDPPIMSSRFGDLQQGLVWWNGYLFQLWLPGRNGTWIHDGSPFRADPEASESDFCVYAWPQRADDGRRAFFVDATGDILASSNDTGYFGPSCPPPVDAALPSSNADGERGDWGHCGRDGGTWVCVQ